MKTAITSAFKSLRITTVALLLLALLVSVGYTGQGKIEFKPIVKTSGEQPVAAGLQSAPSSDDSGGKMAPCKTRHSSPATFDVSPVAYRSGSDTSRHNEAPSYDNDWLVEATAVVMTGRLPYSAAIVSPALGRQFTLVGAKPSGTM